MPNIAQKPFNKILSFAIINTCMLLTGSLHANEAAWPNKPIKVIVPSAPGGGADTIARFWANCASQILEQPIVVENKGGANGIPGVRALKQAPSDGYTLFIAGMSQLTITPYIFSEPPYDPLNDFQGISLLVRSPYILTASNGSGIKKFSDITDIAKKSSDGLNFGSPGNGSPAHLMSAIFSEKLNINFTHIPFQGESAAVVSLAGDQIDISPFIAGTVLPHATAGKVKALAILGETRLLQLPDVPTITEVMGSSELTQGSWTSVIAKKGTPMPIVEKIYLVTQQCLQDPDLIKKFESIYATPIIAPMTAVEDYTKKDTALWAPLINRLDLKNN